LNLEAH